MSSGPTPEPTEAGPASPPTGTYKSVLSTYDAPRLAEILRRIGPSGAPPLRQPRPEAIAAEIADRIAEPRAADALIAAIGPAGRVALGLLSLGEATPWPLAGLVHALGCLGVAPVDAISPALETGLIAIRTDAENRLWVPFADLLDGRDLGRIWAFPHPSAVSASRATLPEGDPPAASGPPHLIRETDGLEPILRLAALWQRIEEAPARRTQQGSLYKRDRDRLDDDPVLAGPIADAIEPLPDMVSLWLDLARGIGLIADEAGTDRVVAARADFWAENGVHLPQMLASKWLAIATWHEQMGRWSEDGPFLPALPFIRAAALLWLARLGPEDWTAIDDLAERLGSNLPDWDRLDLSGKAPTPPEPVRGRGKKKKEEPTGSPLAAVLLGPAYQFGLIRVAEELPTGRRVVQLTPLGRYILALGPPPGPRPVFEHFLFVQPNFEIIAYRQGLNPTLIGQLSRFLRWEKLGAALETRLTAESVYRGLEGGLTTDRMLERLARHSPRPLPNALTEAIRTWSSRRDRVTYFASATLIEFASPEALETALKDWPDPAPIRVSDRLLLVEAEASIPFARFRLAGSRDYRRPPDVCVEVEPDGVTLGLDLGRSDLFVDAELERFADEIAPTNVTASPTRRRFRVSRESLSRGLEDGFTPAALARWFPARTGSEIPPALRLLIHAASPESAPVRVSRPILLTLPNPELLDGLSQYPDTRRLLGDRIGPASVLIPEASIEGLKAVLKSLGIGLRSEP